MPRFEVALWRALSTMVTIVRMLVWGELWELILFVTDNAAALGLPEQNNPRLVAFTRRLSRSASVDYRGDSGRLLDFLVFRHAWATESFFSFFFSVRLTVASPARLGRHRTKQWQTFGPAGEMVLHVATATSKTWLPVKWQVLQNKRTAAPKKNCDVCVAAFKIRRFFLVSLVQRVLLNKNSALHLW